jgi:hypothetical protein
MIFLLWPGWESPDRTFLFSRPRSAEDTFSELVFGLACCDTALAPAATFRWLNFVSRGGLDIGEALEVTVFIVGVIYIGGGSLLMVVVPSAYLYLAP